MANDGAAEGDYSVTVVWRRPALDPQGKPGPTILPARYAKPDTSELKATVLPGQNELIRGTFLQCARSKTGENVRSSGSQSEEEILFWKRNCYCGSSSRAPQ